MRLTREARSQIQAQIHEMDRILAEAERRGLLPSGTFVEFIQKRNPTLMRYEHVPRLASFVDRVMDGFEIRLNGGQSDAPDRVIVNLPPRYFKALADDTPIATPQGWTNIGDLRPGDQVFAIDGTPTEVLAVQQFENRPTYRVQTSDGEEVLADAAHLWEVRRPGRQRWEVLESEELWKWQESRTSPEVRRPALPVPDPLELPEADLPIPPYTLGAWLGDGCSHHATITGKGEDLTRIRAYVEADGFRTSDRSDDTSFGVLGLQRPLRLAGLLKNKHIPPAYFRASRVQRLRLLQGLIDTDGGMGGPRGGQVRFGNTNRRLAEDVRELVHTFGVKASLVEYRASLDQQDMGPAYFVTFYMKGAARLPRKAQHCRDAVEYNQPRRITLEPGPRKDVTCIQVTHPRKLFLAGRGLVPTHNSEIFSRLLPAYFLRRFPDLMAGLASYGAELAWELSEEARSNFVADGGILKAGTEAKKRWATQGQGEMWAAGVGGPILGRGYHLGIVDDPVDPEKALSPTYQRRWRRWWPGKFLSRQEPGALIFVVLQRLGIEDPVDYLFRRETGDKVEKAPEGWHCVILDEVKSSEKFGRWDGPQGLPPTCTLEPDPRKEGELLAPSRFDEEAVKALHRVAGTYVASTQRQQRPLAPKGDFWKRAWFRSYVNLPPDAYDGGQDWDTAYGEDKKNAASARVQSFRGPGDDDTFPIYINDVDWEWMEYPALVRWIQATAGPHYVEAKATGKSAVQSLAKEGVAAEEVQVKGNKLARASAVQPVVANRRVYVQENVLERLLSGEGQGLLRVTAEELGRDQGAQGVDVNDAFVQALTRHLQLHSKPKKRIRFR